MSDSATAVRLLAVDPEFARAVPADDRPLADRALTLPERRSDAGEAVACDAGEEVALVILDGAAWRTVGVGDAAAPQLLGPGSVVLPEPPASDLLALTGQTTALTPVQAVALDRRFLMGATRWPRLTSILHHRLAEQERDVAALAAIAQLPRVEDRLLLLLWHLAERWGTVRSDGVHLPLRLTHMTLGRFVGARRPTVSLALADLRDGGKVSREADGSWTLHGEPPDVALNGRREVSRTPPDLFPVASIVRERAEALRAEARAVRAQAAQPRSHGADTRASADG